MEQLDLFEEAKRIVESGPEEVARWCKLYLKEHQHRIDECNELVTKCNQLEKEKMAMQDTIEELNIMRCELEAEKVKEMSQKIERLEFDNDALEISRDELEKKLKIAITTLKHISCGRLKYPQGTAKRALLEIQEVK